MRKIKSLVLFIFITVIMVITVSANDTTSAYRTDDEAAEILYHLNLFKGIGTDADGNPEFALDRVSNRYEAITMLVRLSGNEENALTGNYEMPFTDVVDWAKPYVAFAYANGYTSGTSATTFSGDLNITEVQFITMLLRILGYDSSKDFTWDNPWPLSDQISLTQGSCIEDNAEFTRGNIAILSERALHCTYLKADPACSLYDKICFSLFPRDYIDYIEIDGNLYDVNIANSSFWDRETRFVYTYNNQIFVPFDPYLYFESPSYSNFYRYSTPSIWITLSKNLFEFKNNDNPFLKGTLNLLVGEEMNLIREKIYTSVDCYYSEFTYNFHQKTLTSPNKIALNTDTTSEYVSFINNVMFLWRHDSDSVWDTKQPNGQKARYGDWYVNINDFLDYFGFDTNISVATRTVGNNEYCVLVLN